MISWYGDSKTKEEQERELWRQIQECNMNRRSYDSYYYYDYTKHSQLAKKRESDCHRCVDYPCKLVKRRDEIVAKILKARGQREVQET